jgi:hypothetical protein
LAIENQARRLGPFAAFVAGILPVVNDQLLFPLLAPLARQDRSLIPWFQTVDSLIVSVTSLAIAVAALAVYRLNAATRAAGVLRVIGVASGSLRGLTYLLVALTSKSLPSELGPADRLLVIGIGAWVLLASATSRRGTGRSSTFFVGLGILLGVVIIAREFDVDLSPLVANVGYVAWFVWLGARLRLARTTPVANIDPG